MPDLVCEPWYSDSIDLRCPPEIDRINTEDQAGPADGAAAQTFLLQPECQRAAHQHPWETADHAQQQDTKHAFL